VAASRIGLLALIILSSGCVVQPVRARGNAMAPTLKDGERLFALRSFPQLERGDIVGFKYPRDESKSFVQRIVGLPGERIEMTNGTVVINGRRLEETYVIAANRSSETWGPRTVADGEYFVMGDNRKNSSDSRQWGTVRRAAIWAKIMGR
jgi:signal peptidase I